MRAWEREEREDARLERAPEPEQPAPRGPGLREVLALQRTAGNQAVSRLLQRTVVVGLPGPNNPRTTYNAANAGALAAALAAPAGMPGWIGAWLAPHATALEASPASYELDTVGDVAWWIVIRELATDLRTYMTQPRVPGQRNTGGDKARIAYAAIEAERVRYAAAGNISGPFQLFGLTYQLTNQGARHFYAARPAGTNIEYHGLPRDRAKAVFNHLVRSAAAGNTATAAYDGPATEVDDFVCAFLAEPTRWPEDQVFNILALMRGGTQELTGGASPNALPMAGGTTWDATLGMLGRQLPKRAVQHATAEGLMVVMRQELNGAGGWPAFIAGMRTQLDFQ